MHLVVIGLNHKTAPVEVRERISFDETSIPRALSELHSSCRVAECAILSTCNRSEVYACTTARADDEVIIKWIGSFCETEPDEFRAYLYSRAGHKAAEHLFRVSAGIDSMVLGEAQILGQVKDAYAAACAAGTTGTVLNALFQQAIAVGKRVRTETQIGRGAFSVGSVAVGLAQSIFGELSGRKVLVVGAGKMAELTLTHLLSSGVERPVVSNRTLERAKQLAERFCGEAVEFERLGSALEAVDIAITSTGSREPIITRQAVAAAMRARRGSPLFFIDTAVPRDVEPGVAELDNVFVYDIDDLQSAVDTSLRNRKAEVAKVEAIVAQETAAFAEKLRTLDAAPVITALREKFEDIRVQELEKLKARLGHLSEQDIEMISAATRSIVNKICHTPMIQMKESLAEGQTSAKLDLICELFGICPADRPADEGESE